MHFRGTHQAARVSGIAGLSGTNAGAVYGPYAVKVKDCFAQPYPTPTGPRPPDSMIFSDKFGYLRQVLNNADWGGVARWYATYLQMATDSPVAFDPLNSPIERPAPETAISTAPPAAPPAVVAPPPVVAVAPPPIIAPVKAPPPIRTGGGGRSGGNERLKGLGGFGDLSGLNPKDYWNISKFNLQDYCDRTFNLSDLHAFTKECIFKMCVADYGTKVGFGYQGPMDNLNIALWLANGLSHSNGQLDWFESYKHAKAGSRYGFCIGWVKEPSKHTASMIIVAVGAAFMGGAAFQAFSAGGSAVGSGVGTGAGAGTGTGVGAGVGAGAGAGAVTGGIETVVVVGSAGGITAGSVAAGLAAGTIAASAAAPALAASTPTIETVVVQAAPVTAISAGTVAGGVAAGTITAVAAAPPIVVPDAVIETVTTEASAINQPVTAGDVAAGLATGAIVATTAPAINSGVIETVTVEAPADTIQIDPVEAAITGVTSIALTQPVINVPEPTLPEIDTEPSLTDRIVQGIEDAIADVGADLVLSELEQYLQDLLGRDPTPTEVDEWEDWINGGGSGPPPTVNDPNAEAVKKAAYWILAAVIAYAVYEYSRKKKRRRTSKRG